MFKILRCLFYKIFRKWFYKEVRKDIECTLYREKYQRLNPGYSEKRFNDLIKEHFNVD